MAHMRVKQIAKVDFSRNDGFYFLIGEKGQFRLMTAELP